MEWQQRVERTVKNRAKKGASPVFHAPNTSPPGAGESMHASERKNIEGQLCVARRGGDKVSSGLEGCLLVF